MIPELSDGLKDLIDGGAAPVTLAEIEQRAAAPAVPSRRPLVGARLTGRPGLLAATVAAAAAVIAAAAVTGTALTGAAVSRKPAPKVILTAAMVRHVAAESRIALASDGRAEVSYRDIQAGALQDSGSDDITFSGQNWNDAFFQTLPASGGNPADTEFAINRIVNGQAYYYIKGQTDKLEWYRDTNQANHPVIAVPDPRTALAVLEPSARFEVAGYQKIAGVRLEVLRATALAGLPGLASMPDVQPGEQVSSLEIWVDRHGVVHRMTISLRETITVYPFRIGHLRGLKYVLIGGHKVIKLQHVNPAMKQYLLHHSGAGIKETQVTDLTVSFIDIGQRQVITAPAHAIPVYGLG